MIQRKQTLFLFAVVALLAAMLFLPIATTTIGSQNSTRETRTEPDGAIISTTTFSQSTVVMDAAGVSVDGAESQSSIALTILIAASTVLALITIFMFKKRKLQLRLCVALGVLLIGIMIYIGLNISELKLMSKSQKFTDISFGVAAIFPFISLILTWLAYAGVKKDINLIRSLDRIR